MFLKFLPYYWLADSKSVVDQWGERIKVTTMEALVCMRPNFSESRYFLLLRKVFKNSGIFQSDGYWWVDFLQNLQLDIINGCACRVHQVRFWLAVWPFCFSFFASYQECPWYHQVGMGPYQSENQKSILAPPRSLIGLTNHRLSDSYRGCLIQTHFQNQRGRYYP